MVSIDIRGRWDGGAYVGILYDPDIDNHNENFDETDIGHPGWPGYYGDN